jgi:hypothetical protein
VPTHDMLSQSVDGSLFLPKYSKEAPAVVDANYLHQIIQFACIQ